MSNVTIRPARKSDAAFIAEGLINAIGEAHCKELAGAHHTVEDVRALFESMAIREDTQYSYLNASVAVDDRDTPVGVCVCYDGERLEEMRRPFLEVAVPMFGLEGTVPDETDAAEVYLDTLYVLPRARKCGVGRTLIEDAAKKGAKIGKPLGLLCDYTNTRAQRLYTSCGFKDVGGRNFFGTVMRHMLRPNLNRDAGQLDSSNC